MRKDEERRMQNYLAVDTSGNHLSVVACKNGVAHTVYLPNCAMKHAVSLMPAVEEALLKADMALSDCDFFAAVVGAGSFTGIRIGISAVKGFALAFNKPTLAVTSFDVIAYDDLETRAEKTLCLVDALHDAYYVCGYQGEEVCYPPAYLMEEEVLALGKEGYVLRACTELPIQEKMALILSNACEGLKKAVERLATLGRFGELTALYVRKSSAELNLENKA